MYTIGAQSSLSHFTPPYIKNYIKKSPFGLYIQPYAHTFLYVSPLSIQVTGINLKVRSKNYVVRHPKVADRQGLYKGGFVINLCTPLPSDSRENKERKNKGRKNKGVTSI